MAVVHRFVAHLDALREGEDFVGEAVVREGGEAASVAGAVRGELFEVHALLVSVFAAAGTGLAEDAEGSRNGLPLRCGRRRGKRADVQGAFRFLPLPFAGYLREELVESLELIGKVVEFGKVEVEVFSHGSVPLLRSPLGGGLPPGKVE